MHLLLILFGVFDLVNKEFKLSRNRKVRGNVSRILGILMLASVCGALLFPRYDLPLMCGALGISIVVGLATAEKVEARLPEQSIQVVLDWTKRNPALTRHNQDDRKSSAANVTSWSRYKKLGTGKTIETSYHRI